jgi:hypothetical protein
MTRSGRSGAAALALLLSAIVLAWTQLPTAWAMRSELLGHRPQHQFTGLLDHSAEDSATYLAWMRQAAEGRFLLEDRYTAEPHPRNYVNLFFWSLGRAAALLGLSERTVYLGARLLFGAVLMALLWHLAGLTFRRPGERLACYALLLVSGGFEGVAGFLERNFEGPHVSSPGWWMAEISTTFSLMVFPHFVAAFACMLLALFPMLRAWERGSLGHAAAAGAVLVVLTFFHPYDTLALQGIVWGTPLLAAVRSRRFAWGDLVPSAVATAVWMPALVYNGLIFRSNPAMRAWDEQGVMTTPEPDRLVLALGATGVLAAVSLLALGRFRRVHLAMLAWVLASLALAHLPLRFQRRLLGGIQFPLAVLATAALAWVVLPAAARAWHALRRREGRRRLSRMGWGTLAVVAALLPTQALTFHYVQEREWTYVRRVRPPSWVRHETLQMLQALDAERRPGDLVLASYALGNLVPALTGARCFVGHYSLTIDAGAKRREAERFYGGQADDRWRRDMVARHGITHVLVTSLERVPGGFDPTTCPWLTERAAFGEGEARAALYAVNEFARSPEAAAAGIPPASRRPRP